MRLTWWAAAALAVAGLAAVSQAQEMPACAAECLETYLPKSECAPTDFDCICADQTLMDSVQTCTFGACTVIEGLAARNATATMCKEPVRDKSRQAVLAASITGIIALAFICVRMHEAYVRKEFHWADLCAVLAMIASLPMNVGEFFMMAHGFGKDIWTLTPEQITKVVKYTWITQVTYVPAMLLPKVAILFFFTRVFPDRTFRLICIGTLVHCALFIVATTITAILACIPIEYAWVSWSGSGEGVCFDNNTFWWAHSAINIATDLWILALPIPQLLKLQLGLKKKVYLILMFSVGILITIMSIIRFSGLITYSTTSNPTYNNVDVATYSVIECNMSIMCCCMPALLSFLRNKFPGVFGSTNRSLNDYNKAGSGPLSGGGGRSGGRSGGGGGGGGSALGGGIQKSVTHTVSYMPRAGDSDVVELMDPEQNKQDQYHPW